MKSFATATDSDAYNNVFKNVLPPADEDINVFVAVTKAVSKLKKNVPTIVRYGTKIDYGLAKLKGQSMIIFDPIGNDINGHYMHYEEHYDDYVDTYNHGHSFEYMFITLMIAAAIFCVCCLISSIFGAITGYFIYKQQEDESKENV